MAFSKKNISPQQLSAERRDVLLEVAAREFLGLGFRGCSIDHISRVSGVSKTTIYRQYPNKEALFEAVALQLSEGMAKLADLPLDPAQPESCLRALADRIYQSQQEAQYKELLRLLIAETPFMPALAQRLRAQMMERLLKTTAAFFAQLIAAGRMQHPDPLHAATTFTVLASGSFRLLLNAGGTARDERNKLDADITLFLRGCRIIGAPM